MAEDIDQQAELPLASAGTRLREARETAGLSRTDIAVRTKIPERHIAALEEGRYAALAGRTYAIGFARTIARTVGLDPEAIAAAVREEFAEIDPAGDARRVEVFEPGDPSRVPDRRIAWLGAGAAFLIVIAGYFGWRTFNVPEMGLPSLVRDTPATPSARPVAADAAARQPGPQSPVVFTATADAIWVKIYDATGAQLMQKQLALGESYTVPADAKDPMIWTGRPEALSVTIGGTPVPPLAAAQVTVKDMPVSAAALLARGTALETAVPTAAATPIRMQPRREPRRRSAIRRPDAASGEPAAITPSPALPVAPVQASTDSVPD